jgi:mono/diheme cytochrome c family protein
MNKNVLASIIAGVAVTLAPHAASSAEAGKSAAKPKAVSAKTIARGKYMVQTGHCNNCHTSGYSRSEGNLPEKEWLLGSAPLGYRGAWGTTYASNLRLTVQSFTEDQWVRYAKSVKPRPPMPWWPLHDTTDADLGAMYQYIKHLGAAGESAPAYLPPDQEPKPPYDWRQLVK